MELASLAINLMGAIPMCPGNIRIRQYQSKTTYSLFIFRLATCFDATG